MTNNIQDRSVSIVIPTFQRPKGIERALKSVLSQKVNNRQIEIIVADNDPVGSAKKIVKSIAQTSAWKIKYVHIPEPGVSNARNGALTHVTGRFIVFLDDDMQAREGWLETLISTALKFDAGIVFSAAIAKMPNPNDPRNKYMAPFFSSSFPNKPEGLVYETLGTGGCLLDMTRCDLPRPPFDTSLNETGGEDDILFDHLRQNGTKAAWSPKAKSWEIVPKGRATPEYIWARNFAFGQGPTNIHVSRGLKGLPGIIRFMTTGTIQLCLYAPIYMVLKLIGHPAYVEYLARTARGLGKVFWANSLSPKFYGTAALKSNLNQPAE